MQHVYLIDFENVAKKGLIGIEQLDSDDLVYIFYSNPRGNITEGLREELFNCRAKLIHKKVNAKSPNALDFQLSVEVGRLIEKGGVTRISIISDDRGYEAVVAYAGAVNPSITIDQQPVITEARKGEVRGYTAEEIKNRQNPLKLGQTLVDYDRNRQFDREMRKIPAIIEIIQFRSFFYPSNHEFLALPIY